MRRGTGSPAYSSLFFVCPMDATTSDKATRIEATNRTVLGTPGSDNFMTMHAAATIRVAAQTSTLAFVENFKTAIHDVARGRQFSFRTSSI
jgi:hypothetical protein